MKVILTILLVSLLGNAGMAYLTYSFHSDKAVAESSLSNCKDANKDLEGRVVTEEVVCKRQDEVLNALQGNLSTTSDEQEVLLDLVKEMKPLKQAKGKGVETSYAGLADKLPPDLAGVLKSAHSKVENFSQGDAR